MSLINPSYCDISRTMLWSEMPDFSQRDYPEPHVSPVALASDIECLEAYAVPFECDAAIAGRERTFSFGTMSGELRRWRGLQMRARLTPWLVADRQLEGAA